jgi:hypothetical protein
VAFLKYSDVGIVEAEEGVIEFEVTKEHLKLLRGMYITWNEDEFGAPSVDPKRPYGNSQVYDDMRAILGELGELYYPEEELDLLHKQTAIALQIVLKTGKYKAAKYRADRYTQGWKEYNVNGRKPKVQADASE